MHALTTAAKERGVAILRMSSVAYFQERRRIVAPPAHQDTIDQANPTTDLYVITENLSSHQIGWLPVRTQDRDHSVEPEGVGASRDARVISRRTAHVVINHDM
jgi:hypothetical protein